MKKILIIIIIAFSSFNLKAQDNSVAKMFEGKVEYISSQFIYVKFENTKGINQGDTLLIKNKGRYIPSLVVESLSSRSCATKSIHGKFKVGELVYIFKQKKLPKEELKESKAIAINKKAAEIVNVDTTEFIGFKKMDKGFYGRFSLSSYSSISNTSNQLDYQNWRYSLSLNADNINNSKFSFSNYITFRYRADEWNSTTSNIGDALKIYDLSIKYDFNTTTNILVGRKINRNVANIGAVDGVQLETKFKAFTIGGVLGSRPDYSNYGLNTDLLEFGGYLTRTDSIGKGTMQNTVSLFQQMNDLSTDRRFLYLQHNNNILPNTSVFLSSEIDLFEKINNKTNDSPRFTSLYLSLRYSPVRWISTSLSYDARQNVIYYETFKNYVDRLVEEDLRQGFRFRINLRPIKYVFASVYSGYRYRESDVKPSRNFGGSVTHSRVPYLNLSANISYISLSTNYLDGNIIGLRLSKDLFNGLVYATLGYRNVDYNFSSTNYNLKQDIAQIDLSFRINRSISFSINFEGTYEGKTSYSNIYVNFNTRF